MNDWCDICGCALWPDEIVTIYLGQVVGTCCYTRWAFGD